MLYTVSSFRTLSVRLCEGLTRPAALFFFLVVVFGLFFALSDVPDTAESGKPETDRINGLGKSSANAL